MKLIHYLEDYIDIFEKAHKEESVCGVKITCSASKELFDYFTGKNYDKIIPKDYKSGAYINKDGIVFVGIETLTMQYPKQLEVLNLINCPSCIELLKKRAYYCDIHGFLSCREVTFTEKTN